MIKKTYHIVYETTCLNTGKKYIGKHSTNNLEDGYLGSGVRLAKEVKRLGKHCFTRRIVSEHESAYKAFGAERDLLKSSGAEYSTDYYNLPEKKWNKKPKLNKVMCPEKLAKRTIKIDKLKSSDKVKELVIDCLSLQNTPSALDGTVNKWQRRTLCSNFDLVETKLDDAGWPEHYCSLSKNDNKVKAFNSLALIHKKYNKLTRIAIAELIYSHFSLL